MLVRCEQEAKNLRVCFSRPAGERVEQQKHKDPSQQTAEQVEGSRADAHGDEEEFSFRAENRQRPRNRSIDCIHPPAACHAFLLREYLDSTHSHGKSQARKLTAAMAMPTPKRTPASTRLEPPSPKANVRPDTTMATKERPRAMVLVKACCSTLTAFSHGELPDTCAKPGTARTSPAAATSSSLNAFLNRRAFFQWGLILRPPPC